MTALAKGNLVVRGVAAYLPALQMVDVKPDLFFLGCVCSTTLASVAVSPKHVLTHIVVTVHLALLVILTLRDRFAFLDGFQQLQVELSGLYDHFARGQDAANHLDGGDVLLDFHLHRWRQPTLAFASDSVIEARLAIPGLAISSGSAELSTGGHQVHHIIPRSYVSCKDFFLLCGCGHSDGLTSSVHAQNDFLGVAAASVDQLDGKGRPLLHFGFPVIQEMPSFCRGAGHQRTPVFVDDIHFVWHDAFLLLL